MNASSKGTSRGDGLRERDGSGNGGEVQPLRVPFGGDPELARALVLFYWIGRAYEGNSISLSKVSAALDAMEQRGEIPPQVAISKVSVKLAAMKVRKFFGRHFGCDGLAPIFVSEGQSFTGLSELGLIAWKLTRDWMIKHGYST